LTLVIKMFDFSTLFKRILERFHTTKKTFYLIELLKLLFTILTVAHFLACLWIIVGKSSENSWMDAQRITDLSW